MPDRDQEFVEVSIEEFATGKPVPYAIYIRLTSWKYLQIASPGDGLDRERVDVYRDRNVKCLYLLKEDFARYVGFAVGPSAIAPPAGTVPPPTAAVPAPQPPPRPAAPLKPAIAHQVNLLKNAASGTLSLLKSNGINEFLFEASKDFVQSTISVLADDQNALQLLSAINTQQAQNPLYEHSVGVTLYSIMLARVLGWRSAPNFFKLGMGAMLHDIGFNSMDDKLMAKREFDLTPAERKQREQHAEWGAQILKQLTSVPPEVLAIALQHHEHVSGKGYPKGLKSAQINPMSKIVAVADRFCELVLDGPDSPRLSPESALQQLFDADAYDADVLSALKRLLKNLP
ncbi:MAG: HD domain-containing protein [Deltaproteobacteria bacterium]|nr:HD domain-containing protein [Deltaproteobacteria bacterium]